MFLYVFLDGLSTDHCEDVRFRCITNPFKSLSSKINTQLLEYTSFVCYSLTLLKILDNCRDSKNRVYRLLKWLLLKNKRYIKLQQRYLEVDNEVKRLYDVLHGLEKNACQDFDLCSDTMGNVLSEIVGYYMKKQEIECETACKFAKHLGMWIYLVDAYDDYEIDVKRGLFNPLRSFDQVGYDGLDIIGNPTSNSPALLYAEIMLGMMIRNMIDCVEELDFRKNGEIIKNIIRFGTVDEVKRIQDGKKKNNELQREQCRKH